MQEIFKYIITLSLLSFVACNDELVLEDTWEGERLFIAAEMVVGDSLEVKISRTFNPILSAYPDDVEIADASVALITNSTDSIGLHWNDELRSYTTPYVITSPNCYRVIVIHDAELITSKEVCIPEVGINIVKDSLYADNNDFYFAANISLDNVDAYNVRFLYFFSPTLDRNYSESGAFSDIDTPCYTRTLDVNCLGDSNYNLVYSNSFFNYKYDPRDYFAMSVSFLSKELEDITTDNSYNNGEFEINSSFTSSFDNAYGIFGYIYNGKFIFPFGE